LPPARRRCARHYSPPASASELNVSEQVTIVNGDAAGWVSPDPIDIAACVGATWIGGVVTGTIELLRCFVDAHPDDPITDELRDELRSAPLRHVRFQRAWRASSLQVGSIMAGGHPAPISE
jgi:hypothetical protein